MKRIAKERFAFDVGNMFFGAPINLCLMSIAASTNISHLIRTTPLVAFLITTPLIGIFLYVGGKKLIKLKYASEYQAAVNEQNEMLKNMADKAAKV